MKKCILLIVFLSAMPYTTIADGKFFSTSAKYTPGIPRQRAMIVYRDGVETIIIDNYVKSNKGSLAWVVPVPTEPTNIAALDNGIYDSLDVITEPILGREISSSKMNTRLFQLTAYLLLVILFCFYLRFKNRRKYLKTLSILIFILLLTIAVNQLPTLNRARKLGGFPVSVIETSRWTVGSYTAKAIRATNTQDLVKWLTDNGYAKPTNAGEIETIKNYIDKGWHFVVAKIRDNHSGELNPHPLAISFKTTKPVYPLKLTKYNSSPETVLELMVIADEKAIIKPLEEVFCSRLKKIPLGKYKIRQGIGNNSFQYVSERIRGDIEIGRGQLSKYLWPGCVVTKYHDKLATTKMNEDIPISFSQYKPYLIKYYSPKAIASLQFERLFILTLPLPICIGLIILPGRKKKKIGIALLVILIPAMIFWPMQVKKTVTPLPDFIDVKKNRHASHFRPSCIVVFPFYLSQKKTTPTAENLEQLYKDFTTSDQNRFGLSGRRGVGPAQYQIKTIDSEPVLIIYDVNGYGHKLGLKEIITDFNRYTR